jgi:hypothetical protein
MTNTFIIAAVAALAVPAHADESLAQAESNFHIACDAGRSSPAQTEACGIALQYGYDVTLAMLSVCIKTGATGDALMQCVKRQGALVGFQ